MTKAKQTKFKKNLIKFLAPNLAVFFGQLAMGVEIKAALLVTLLGIYGTISDYLSKIK